MCLLLSSSTAPLCPAPEEKNTDAPEDNYTRAALWLQKTTYEPGHAARYRIEHILRSAYHLTPEQTSSLLKIWDALKNQYTLNQKTA